MMSKGLLGKLFSALKGGATEVGEAIADSQAIRILEQEMREAKGQLEKSGTSLTTIIAKRKLSENKVTDLNANIAKHEKYAMDALEAGNETLAVEVAEKIAEFETQKDMESGILQEYVRSEEALRSSIKKAKHSLRLMEQQVDTVKATESVQKAQVAVSSSHMGATSRMKSAADSLERLKEKQKLRSAELSAANELAADESGNDLEKKLKDAGIIGASSGHSVLERLKKKA